jgi:uncharacterized protein (DUF2147 family)
MSSYQTRIRTSLGLLAVATLALMSATPARANVEGVWLAKDGGTVRIRNCGDGMCGMIASVGSRGGSAGDANPRNRVGVPVLMGMRPNGPNKWTGRLYNVDDGKTYEGNLIELGPDSIRIEGCALFICGGENLTRVKSTASTP